MSNETKKTDTEMMAHDIANALLPALNYPERVKVIGKNLEYGFQCLKHIQRALSTNDDTGEECPQNDNIKEKLAPALGELCRLGEKYLEQYRIETEKLSLQMEKINGLVAGNRSSAAGKPENNGKL